MNKKGLLFVLLFLSMLIGIDNSTFAKDKITSQTIDSTKFNESQAYRMLYENQVKSNDAILKTIFYALGGLASAIVLVFASNWWFNEKKVLDIRNGITAQINEAKNAALNEVETKIGSLASEKTAQINELQIKLQEQIAANIAELVEKNTVFHEKIRAEIKEDNKSLLNNYQAQLEEFNKSYRQEVTTLSENIKNQTDNINTKISNTAENLKNLVSSRIDSVKRRIARNEFYLWKSEGVLENALSAQIEELRILLKQPSENRNYQFYLEQISETLDELPAIDKSTKETTIETVKQVPEKFNKIKSEIYKKIEKIKTAED